MWAARKATSRWTEKEAAINRRCITYFPFYAIQEPQIVSINTFEQASYYTFWQLRSIWIFIQCNIMWNNGHIWGRFISDYYSLQLSLISAYNQYGTVSSPTASSYVSCNVYTELSISENRMAKCTSMESEWVINVVRRTVVEQHSTQTLHRLDKFIQQLLHIQQ